MASSPKRGQWRRRDIDWQSNDLATSDDLHKRPQHKTQKRKSTSGVRFHGSELNATMEDGEDDQLAEPSQGYRRVKRKRSHRAKPDPAPSIFNEKVALRAIEANGRSLRNASQDLRSSRAIVLLAVTRSGMALQYASTELRGDTEIVMKAVTQNGMALQHASAELRSSRSVALRAVSQDAWALFHAAAALQQDPDVVLSAVMQDDSILECVSKSLLGKSQFVQRLIDLKGHAVMEYLPEATRYDREILLQVVTRNPGALARVVPSRLLRKRDFALRLARTTGMVIKYLPPGLRNDLEVLRIAGERLLPGLSERPSGIWSDLSAETWRSILERVGAAALFRLALTGSSLWADFSDASNVR